MQRPGSCSKWVQLAMSQFPHLHNPGSDGFGGISHPHWPQEGTGLSSQERSSPLSPISLVGRCYLILEMRVTDTGSCFTLFTVTWVLDNRAGTGPWFGLTLRLMFFWYRMVRDPELLHSWGALIKEQNPANFKQNFFSQQ